MSTKNLRRFTDHNDAGAPYRLDPTHIAARLGTSLFREGRLQSARFAGEPLLKSGHNSRKIGKTVVKGKWSGYPVYTLTLEERATCPRSCHHWLDCYGNKMNWPTRFMADGALVPMLDRELRLLAKSGPFVVRLHVLGDFYSVRYVVQWEQWLDLIPELHVYGYTAWQDDTPIGHAVADVAARRWDRFAVRTSNASRNERSTLSHADPHASGIVENGIVCPAQTGKTECCATCAICWQTQRRIVFLEH